MQMIKPQKKQELFLATKADIALYGGAAGAGKSFCLMLESLRHINNARYRAVLIRRNISMLTQGGGLFEKGIELYSNIPNVKINRNEYKFTFKNGSSVKLDHMNNTDDYLRYQGSEYDLICFDELTQFDKRQFDELVMRSRSTSGIKPYIRCTTNPKKSSWVRQFIDWWIGDDGFPIPERSGIIRYFTVVDNEYKWADTRQELFDLYASEKDSSIYKLSPKNYGKSFTFVAANITDNKYLLEAGYASSLQAGDRVQRAIFLEGNWNIDYDDGNIVIDTTRFKFYKKNEGFPVFEQVYFVADTAMKVKTHNDYSVLMLVGKTKGTRYYKSKWLGSEYYIIDLIRVKKEAPELIKLFINQYDKYREIYPISGIYIEEGMGTSIIQLLKAEKLPIKELKTMGVDKYTRLCNVLDTIESERVHLPLPSNQNWVATFIQECNNFRASMKHILLDGETMPHDDQVDTLVYALCEQIKSVGAYAQYNQFNK